MAEAQVDTDHTKLNCPICLETFESPKVLTCLHTFCEKCIIKHVCVEGHERRSADPIFCPICRNPISAPAAQQTWDDWAEKLPTNTLILTSMVSEKSGKDDVVYCQPCLTDGTRSICVAYCVTCSEYLCQVCYDCHKKFKVCKDHTITLQSMPGNRTLRETKDKLFRCSRHMKKYTYICLRDKDLCCSKCATTDHKNCKDLFSIENVAKACKDSSETKKVLENLDSLRNMFLTLLENRSNNFDSIQQTKANIIMEVKEWTKEVKERTDKLETATLEKLEQVYKVDAVTISDQIVECKSAIAAIETSKMMLLEEIKSDSDDTKTFMTLTRVSQQIRRYIQKHDVVQNKFKNIQIQFQRDKNFEGIIRKSKLFGQVLNRSSQIPALSSDRSYEKLKMLLPRVQLDSMVTFNSNVPEDENQCDIYSGIFLPDDRFVVCDQGNWKIKLFDKCFHCVSYLKITNEPRFMCSVDTETVAVASSGRRIHIVSVANQLANVGTFSVDGDCYGIAYSQNYIILDTIVQGHFSLDIYDKSYKLITRIQRPNRTSLYYNISRVSPDGQIIHCTAGNAMFTMDMNGKTLNTFQSNDLIEALGITTDKNGILYCCGSKSKTVVQVTSEGRQLGVLLSSDHGLKNPVCVILNDRNNMIMVLEGKSDEIKVFRLI